CRKTKIRHRSIPERGCRNKVQFVGTERFIRINQAVNSIVLEVQIPSQRMKRETRGISQPFGDPREVRCDDVGNVICYGEHVNRLTLERSCRPWYFRATHRRGPSGFGEVLIGTQLEKEIPASRLAWGWANSEGRMGMLPTAGGVIYNDLSYQG